MQTSRRDGPRQAVLAFLAHALTEIFGFVLAIPVIALGILFYGWFPWIGFEGAAIGTLVVFFGIGFGINRLFGRTEDRIRTRWFGLPTVEESKRRRADRAAAARSVEQPRSGLRQRLIDMGVRSKDDPPPGSEAKAPPRNTDSD